jgi:hypothetical protein
LAELLAEHPGSEGLIVSTQDGVEVCLRVTHERTVVWFPFGNELDTSCRSYVIAAPVKGDPARAAYEEHDAVLRIKNCGKCPYVDHSGAFTPGGAKDICGHPEAVETFTSSVDRDDPNQDKWHWRHRAVDRELPPPAECPLRQPKGGD